MKEAAFFCIITNRMQLEGTFEIPDIMLPYLRLYFDPRK